MILSESLDTIVVEVKCSSKQIQVLKYSPDGKTLAIGCHDQKIHLFDALSYKKRGECKGHSSTITHLDFSKDSKVLQSNSAAYELLFWEVTNGKQITSSNAVRDVAWETWTCTMGWPSQGIWPPSADGTDINAVCRSSDQQVLASVDDNGQVKLFRYPCTNPKVSNFSKHGISSSSCTVLTELSRPNTIHIKAIRLM
jgi:WD40 repeat protein